MAYPAVQRHDGEQSEGRAGLGGGGCEEATVSVLSRGSSERKYDIKLAAA